MDYQPSISDTDTIKHFYLKLNKNKLTLCETEEDADYLLTTADSKLINSNQLAANKHLSMQIAKQAYGIHTVANAIIYFQDQSKAYIAKQMKQRKTVNFLALSGNTLENSGENYMRKYNYEDAVNLIKKNVPAWRIEIERFYSQILFNYLFNNGAADLSKFSLVASSKGDYMLCPAYNLFNSRIHNNNNPLGLTNGLFSDNFQTNSFRINGIYAYDDFYEYAIRIGIREDRATKILNFYRKFNNMVSGLIHRSYLSEWAKEQYFNHYQERLKALNFSNSGLV